MVQPQKTWFLLNGKQYRTYSFERLFQDKHPAVYEVIRIVDGRPVFPREHYDRLIGSLRTVHANIWYSYQMFIAELSELADANGITDYNCQLWINGFDDKESPSRYLYLIPTYYPVASQYRDGVTAGILRAVRGDPHAKIWNTGLREQADALIRDMPAYEAVLLDQEDRFTEGSRSSLFFIKGRKVMTAPEEAVLLGVTRQKVIEMLKGFGIPVEEAYISLSEAADCDAAFICGTSLNILPLQQLGTVRFDPQNVLLRQIMDEYDKSLETVLSAAS